MANVGEISKNFDQIVLFVHTHSDEERGDLMYCGDGATNSLSTGISDVSGGCFDDFAFSLTKLKFFETIVGSGLRDFVLGRKYSLMVLAACGSVVNHDGAREELREVANKYVRPTSLN